MSQVYRGAHRSVFLFLIALATPGFSQESVFVKNPGLPALGKSSVQWADFDNDGWPDVVMNGTDAFGTKQCAIYRNQRDNSFVNLGAGLPPTDDGDLAVGDVNLDGFIDILISGWNTQNQRISRLYLNQGGGNFVPDTTPLAGVALGKSAIVDVDNDGRPDLLLTGINEAAQTEAYLYRQQRDGSFRLSSPEFTAFHSGDWVIADMNNDAYPDVLLSGIDANNQPTTQLWLNQYGQSFSSVDVDLPHLANATLSAAHLDDDGWYDIFLAGQGPDGQDTAVVYTNTGLANFRRQDSVATVSFAASTLIDFDQDGDTDLLFTGADRSGYYYRNRNGVDFIKESSAVPSLLDGSVTWTDVNRDQAADYLLAGYRSANTPVSLLFVNQNLTSNTPPAAPGTLQAVSQGDSVLLYWDPATDAETSSRSLTYQLRVGTAPDTADVVHPESFLISGTRKVMQPGRYATNRAVTRRLAEGRYYWSVQAIDASGIASPFAPVQSFDICYPPDLGDDRWICQGETLTLTAGAPSDVVNWCSTVSGSLATNQPTLEITVESPDTLVVETVKPTGCILYDTLIVNVLNLPNEFPPADAYVCQGDSVILFAGDAHDTVRWLAHPDSVLANNTERYSTVVTSEDSVLVEITNPNGCQQQRWTYLHPIPLPEINLVADTTICYGSTLELTPDKSYDALNWYSARVGLLADDADTLRYRLTEPDTLWAEAYNARGCVQRDTIIVRLRPLPPANAGPDTVVCRGGSVPIGDPTVNTADLQFRWSPARYLDDPAVPNPIANPPNDQTYVLTVIDAFGCQNYDTVTVRPDSATVVDPGPDRYICFGSTTTLGTEKTAQGSLLSYRYQWTPTESLDDPLAANPLASPRQTTTYQLIVFTEECPVDTATVTVEVKPLPIVNILEDTVSVGYRETVTLHAEGGASYLWYPSQGVEDYRRQNPQVSPEQTTRYYVAGQDALGCQHTDSVVVIVRNDLFIPTLFTPNDDGNNDTFQVYGYGVKDITLSIFDRHGKLLFRTQNPEVALGSGWDGTSNGYPQPPGVYTWSVRGQFHDQRPLLFRGRQSGTFKLIR